MADEHLFTAEVERPATPVQRKSGWQSCLTGCLIAFVILVVIAILIGFWISRNWRNWAAAGSTGLIRQAMTDSQLPVQEQQEVLVQVDRVATAFREKKISSNRLVLRQSQHFGFTQQQNAVNYARPERMLPELLALTQH
jgi:hypothetical protein